MFNNIFKKQRYYFEGDGEMVIDMGSLRVTRH